MIPADLIDILRCPQTGLTLAEPRPELLAEINARIGQGDSSVRNQAGDAVREVIDSALIRSDGTAIYPVRDGIPVLLVDAAVLLPLP